MLMADGRAPAGHQHHRRAIVVGFESFDYILICGCCVHVFLFSTSMPICALKVHIDLVHIDTLNSLKHVYFAFIFSRKD